jgi:WD40 repeat protein
MDGDRMPGEGQRRGVFVSYARSDGEAFARKLVRDLEAEGLEVWMDRLEMYGGRGWQQQIVDAIGQAAFMVLVMTPEALTSEVVAWEWRLARREGVCVFPVRVDPQSDFTALPRWMSGMHWYTLDREWDVFLHALKHPCEVSRVPFMAGALPNANVQRHQEMEGAKRLLINSRGDPIPATMVLHGSGGYGKTTLALALCHDEDVSTAFYDGILWVSLGQQPNVLGELDRLHRALTGRTSGAVDEIDAARAVKEQLETRRCLLVIDDAWWKTDLSPFLPDSYRNSSARLVTTRRFDLVQEAGHHILELRIDEMAEYEAVDMLTSGIQPAPSDLSPYQALVQRLGGWPLLVNLARGALRTRIARGAEPERALRSVNEAFDRHDLTAFDASKPEERNDAAAASVSVSLESLDDEEITRWSELAVFPEDTRIPIATLAQLWELDGFETEEFAGRLADSSLVHLDLETNTIEVHDVLLAVAQRRAGALVGLHRRLVAAWGDLRTMPDDDHYAWQWVAYHLVGAGEVERLRGPLLDPAWMERRLRATNIDTLLGDYDLPVDGPAHGIVREALQLSASTLAADGTQLASQLRGRLLSVDLPEIQALLARAAELGLPRLVPLTASLIPPRSTGSPGPSGHQTIVQSLAIADRGRLVVSGSGDGTLKVWDRSSGSLLRTIEDDQHDVDLAARWGGQVLLAGFEDRPEVVSSSSDRLNVWNLETGTRVRVLDGDKERRTFPTGYVAPVAALKAAPDGRQIIFAVGDELRVWNLDTDGLLVWPAGRSTQLVFAGNDVVVSGSSYLAAGSTEQLTLEWNALQVWGPETGQLRRRLEGNPCGICAMAVTADGRYVISAPNPGLYMYEDSSLRAWDMETGEAVRAFRGHRFTVTAVAVTPDQRMLVSGGGSCFARYDYDFTVKLWDFRTGDLVHTFGAHSGPVVSLQVSPDSRWAVSAAGGCGALDPGPQPASIGRDAPDGSIRVWDLRGRALAATFKGDSAATCLLMAGQETLVAGSANGAVHFLRFEGPK